MNRTFREVAEYYKCGVLGGPLTHQQRVTRLYRQALKLLTSWTTERDIWCDEAEKLRAQFDSVKTLEAGKTALYYGEKKLLDYEHPDPYVVNYMPGGTSFMRNPTPPPEIQYPDCEIPVEAYTGRNTPMYPDGVPASWRPRLKTWLIDPMKKKML